MDARILVVIAALILISGAPCLAVDTDGDGIPHEVEEILGTDPNYAETLHVIYDAGQIPEDERDAAYDPTKDIVRIEFGHVAEDRFLWRTVFAAEPNLEDAVHHIYLDTDLDETTGREDMGCEYMVSMGGGSARSRHFMPDGTEQAGPPVRMAVVGNSLYKSADLDLEADADGVRFRIWVLSHTARGVDYERMHYHTGRFIVEGLPLNDRRKLLLPGDLTENTNVAGTFGLDIIRAALVDEANVAIKYQDLEVDGFAEDLNTRRRWGHLYAVESGARAWHTVETPGRWYIGFLTYDDGGDHKFAIRVNDEVAGVAVVHSGNRREWICHLDEPRDLQAGDVLGFEAVGGARGSGNHHLAKVLLLAEPPGTREIEYRVENTNWIAPVNTEGEAWISWTTTWPSASRFEYGPTADYGEVAEEDTTRLVHRAHLSGLEPGVTYHGRGVGTAPDGSEYHGPDIAFNADGIQPPPSADGVNPIPLVVRNRHAFDAEAWPVSSGVPFPQGALGSEGDLRLMRDGDEVLAQFRPLGTWPDGSIKWVLVTILADVPAGESAGYVLEYGREVDGMAQAADLAPMAVEEDGEVLIDTGAVRLRVDAHGQLVGPGGPVVTELVESARGAFSSALSNAEVTIEETGPVRTVVRSIGDLAADDGSQSLRIDQRVEAWRGQAFVRVHHTFINTLPDEVSRTTLDTRASDRFVDIDRISLVVPSGDGAWRAPVVEGEPLQLTAGDRVWQRFDDEFALAGTDPAEGRIIGGLIAEDGGRAISVRDFWQNYPKGFEITQDAVRVDLAPAFEAGLYDEFPFEDEGHHLFFYLRDGSYTFTRGMAKTHELLLDFAEGAARRAEIFQRPLLLTAEPEWYCDSKVFYDVAPRGEERFSAYEEAIDANIENYLARRERQRDYGLMNYGDWYGERGVNWGNIEYDTQLAFFLEYIRSGNPEAFFLGEAAQIHNRDIDAVHWSPDGRETGLLWVHQMGHVGGYYDEAVPDTLGIPRSGGNMGHAWTEGQFTHYALTGDIRSLETAIAVADYWTHRQLSRPYDWHGARDPGWHLIMLTSALAMTNDPYYLNAARVVVDRVLQTQDTEPRELPDYQKRPGRTHQHGGWTRQAGGGGHCRHEQPKCRVNANFMVAVLLNGMTYYYDVTGDPEVRDSIILGAHYLMDEFYSTETHGFRYTGCPEMPDRFGVSPMYMVEAIACVYRWTGDETFLDPLTNGLAYGAGGSAYGKGFSAYYRSAPRVLANLAAVGLSLEERERPEPVPFEEPDWMAELGEDEMIVVQAEDFVDQGEGEVQIRDDRHGAWGEMITFWQQDIGHWLEWRFAVPRDGNYRVIFHYATNTENTRREFTINGEVPHEAAAEIAFPRTGGFGTGPQDWRYLPLQDAAGDDVVLPLAAGEHTIRMTNLGDGLGLDFIVLIRED